jgi:hypothetical protein
VYNAAAFDHNTDFSTIYAQLSHPIEKMAVELMALQSRMKCG